MRRGRPAYPDILTPREWEVLSLLQEGLTNPQIAQRLGVTEGAAKFHVSQILAKFGVESRQEAAGYTAAPRRAWLLLPFLAFAESWKPAVRRWWSLAAVTAAAVTTMALIVLMGVSSVGGGREGASPGVLSTLDEALGPDEPPAQATAVRGPEAPLGSTCEVTLPPENVTRDFLSGHYAGMGRDPFCIAWTDIYTDETGFRVVVRYNGGEEFVYHLPANVNEVFPPTSEGPDKLPAIPAASTLASLKRKDIQVMVYAKTSSGEVIVGGLTLTLQ